MPTSKTAIDLAEEFEDADFGDKRLTARAMSIVEAVSAAPDASLPAVMDDDAALEGTYRFANNERVTPERILAPHLRRTAERAQQATTVLVPHDTTQCNYGVFEREGLGRVGRGKSYGYYAHVSLVLSDDGKRDPLGIAALRTILRPRGKKRRLKHGKAQDDPTNESRRWLESVEEVEALLEGKARALHLMDREGDNYAHFVAMVQRGTRFVVRMQHDRRLQRTRSVRSIFRRAPILAEKEVPLSARRKPEMPTNRKRHPERASRIAKLAFRAQPITLPRPSTSSKAPLETLTLNLVHVQEVDTPDNVEPVCWWLWTTEPIDTVDQIFRIADAYCARWRIEEFFKALKTGCALEKRQFQSCRALLNVLALLTPIAWRLLRLRTLGRMQGNEPAEKALTPTQIRCLRFALLRKRKIRLPQRLTVREAMLGVAKLGGHIANNGDPGWIVLGRGYQRLLDIEYGLLLATRGTEM